MGTSIVILAAFGILLSLGTLTCVVDLPDPKDAKMFGKVHWSLIGAVGYTLLIITAGNSAVTMALAIIIAAVTPWLIFRAFKLRMICPLCLVVWLVNVVIVILAFVQG